MTKTTTKLIKPPHPQEVWLARFAPTPEGRRGELERVFRATVDALHATGVGDFRETLDLPWLDQLRRFHPVYRQTWIDVYEASDPPPAIVEFRQQANYPDLRWAHQQVLALIGDCMSDATTGLHVPLSPYTLQFVDK